jgi:hypothetical protein
MSQAIEFPIPSPALPASPRPLAQSIGSGFVPVIYHPERNAEYTRFERIRGLRKAKATPAEALAYAERALHYRTIRANEKRRHIEAIEHPHYFLEAAE